MKKIKLFLITVVCALCLCFAFAGCATGGSYIENSFTINSATYYSYDKELHVSGSFDVKLNKAGEYTVEYELCQTDTKGKVIARETFSTTLTKSAETNKTEFTVNLYKDIPTSNTSTNVKIENVKVTLVDAKPDYYGYAVGFGLVGAMLLGGLVAVFVLDKLGKLDKLK